jgi:hypothetical protein
MEKKEKQYSISSFVKDGILEVVVTGDISTPFARKAMMNEIIDMEKSANVEQQLVDVRSLRGRLAIFEVYGLVRDYPEDRPKMIVALVDTPENAESASFHETTASNAGVVFKWFTDTDEARNWLKNRPKR